MTAIGKIRSRSGMLIAIIGIALLAFVLGDLFKSTGRQREDNIAVVDGEEIAYQAFHDEYSRNHENMKRNSSQPITQTEDNNLRNTVLENMIKEKIMGDEYKAIGMSVTPEELYDQFTGENPHPWVVQNFPGEDGGLNREMLQYYMQNIENMPPDMKATWKGFEESVKENRLETKFNNLVKASFFMPNKLAEQVYKDKNNTAQAEVIALRYSHIADSTINITDADNRKFYEENKYRFKTDATRDVEYVVFDIRPSQEDKDDARLYVDEMKGDFALAENAEQFVNNNSDSDSRYDSSWRAAKDVPAQIEEAVFGEGSEIGKIIGPYEDNNAYNLARIVDKQNRPDSLRASHILISYKGAQYSNDTLRTKEEAKHLADSLLNVVKTDKKADFAALATQFSSDPGSNSEEKGGDLDWFNDGMMVYNFNEYVVNNPVGSVGVVETPFGFHVIKVTDKTEAKPKARLAIVRHSYSASDKTFQEVLAKANRFVTENVTYDQFTQTAETEGLAKRSYPNLRATTYQITGIEDPRQIVKWAFDDKTKIGNVSPIFEFTDALVVASLVGSTKEGYVPMEKAVQQSRAQILNMKKGEEAVKRMKACGDDYNRMVSELGAEMENLSDVKLESRNLGNFGVEAAVIGKIMSMDANTTSEPIAGNTSAFIIKNVKKTDAPASTDFSNIVRDKQAQFNNKVLNNAVYNALRENAKIVDNRVKFY